MKKSFLGIVISTAAGVLFFSSVAGAAIEINGTSMNGANLNGANLNGVVLNGVGLNGISMNGLNLESIALQDIKVEGGQLVAVKQVVK